MPKFRFLSFFVFLGLLHAACVSITFLNSRTILGGLELWGPSVKLGLSPPKDPNAYADFEAAAHELLTTKADSGDGKIEVFSMGSTADYVQAQAVRRKQTNALN